MCGSSPPAPPDMGPLAVANEKIARIQQQVAMDQLDWSKQQDVANRDILNRVLNVQLPAMEEQASNAREDRQRYETQFIPLENKLVEEAQTYDTPERRAMESGRAIADVNTQFDAQRRNALSRLEGFGVDPSQTRNAALDIGTRVAQAATAAGAGTNAVRRVEDTGRALRADAVNLGRGLPSIVSQSYGQSTGAGQAAVGGANQTTGTSSGAMQGASTYFGGAMQGYNNSANIQTMGFNNQMTGWNANQARTAGNLQAIGGVVGMAAGLADGGPPRQSAIPFDDDGMVATGLGDGSGIDDTVPALVSDGEYVIPADVVRAKGVEFFDKLVAKYHKPAAQQRQEMVS